MNASNKLVFFNIYHLLADLISLLVSYYISYILAYQFTSLNSIKEYLWIVVIYLPVWIFIMSVNGMYDETTFTYYDRIFKSVIFSTVFSSLLVYGLRTSIKDTMYNGLLFFIFFLISLILMLIERYALLYVIKNPNSKHIKRVMFVGIPSLYEKFNYFIQKTDIKVLISSCISIGEDPDLNKVKLKADVKAFQRNLKEHIIDEVYFAIPIRHLDQIKDYVLVCDEMGITSRILIELSDMTLSRVYVASLGTFPMLTVHSVSLNNLQLYLKRVLDVIGAIVGLVLSSLIFMVVAIAIKHDSPGPIFYYQNRVGISGRIFKLYKFRSMYIDANERRMELESQNEMRGKLMFKLKNDPRVTKVGKFLRKASIDELPQFLNVLIGDMSLVGTRPPTMEEVSHYRNYHRRRISIKPGITGMWQVSGRNNITSFDEIVKLDTKYIDQWSIWLDIKIIFKTIFVVLNKRGAS